MKFTIDGRFNKPNSSSSKHQKRVNINTFQHSNIVKKKTHGEQYKYVQNLGYVLIHTKKKVDDMNENQYDTTYDNNNKKKQHGGQKTTIKNAKSTLDLFRKVNGLKVSSVDVKKQQEERLRRRTMMPSPRSSSSSSTNTITTSNNNNKHQRMMKKRQQQQKTRYSRSASHSATSRLSPFNSPDSNSSGGEGGYDSDDSRRRNKSLSPTDKQYVFNK